MQVFFGNEDYRLYRELLKDQSARHGVDVWAYAQMPNHVHLLAVPSTSESLAKAFGQVHRQYAYRINRRHGWTGHLWQERFASFPMSEKHLFAAVRYVLLNPVRGGLVENAVDWEHSSVRAHLDGRSDGLVDPVPMARRVADFGAYLSRGERPSETRLMREHSRTGFPLGEDSFIDDLERKLDRRLRPEPSGPKPS